MGIGAGIFLFAVGAILTFAMDMRAYGIDFDVVGFILMVAGALGLIVSVVIYAPRRSQRQQGPAYDPRYDPRYDARYDRPYYD
ncbi:MAG: hypothetical protein GEV03_09995 [Streptosporangiales bacterium]|nr:hypothetical protein [Streptosporangiales bacterium]